MKYCSNIKLPILDYIVLPIVILLEKAAFLTFSVTMLQEWKLWFLLFHFPFAFLNVCGFAYLKFVMSADKFPENDTQRLNYCKDMIRCIIEGATSLCPILFIAISTSEDEEYTDRRLVHLRWVF